MKRCEATLDFLDGHIWCERDLEHKGKHAGRDTSESRLRYSSYEWGRGDSNVSLSSRSPARTNPVKEEVPEVLGVMLRALSAYQEAVKAWEAAGRPGLPPEPPREAAHFGGNV
jgi:hypothetical protein